MNNQAYTILSACVVLALGSLALALVATNQSPPNEDLIGEATIGRPAHLTSNKLGSTDDRINLDPKETVTVDLKLNAGKGKIRLTAPNGGSINRGHGHAEMDPPSNDEPLRVDFAVGTSPGRYTLEASQGNRTRTLEFWVGPEPTQGEPGPNRTFVH